MRFSFVPFFFKTPSLVEPRRTIRIVKRQHAFLTTSLLTLIAVKRQKRRSQKCSLSLNYANGAPWLDQRRRFKKEGLEAKPHAFTTAVLTARSPTRRFLPDVHIRMAPSKYGIKNWMASITRRMLRTAAPA